MICGCRTAFFSRIYKRGFTASTKQELIEAGWPVTSNVRPKSPGTGVKQGAGGRYMFAFWRHAFCIMFFLGTDRDVFTDTSIV